MRVGMYFCHSGLVFYLHQLLCWSFLLSPSVAALVFLSSPSVATPVLSFLFNSCHTGLVFHLHHLPHWSCFSSPSLATVVLLFIFISCHTGLVFHLHHLPQWSCLAINVHTGLIFQGSKPHQQLQSQLTRAR